MENNVMAEESVKIPSKEKKTYYRQTLTAMQKAENEVMSCGCAHIKNGKCEAMEDPACRHREEPCPFCQTLEEAEASIERYNTRMRSLPILQQHRYAEKYHKGMMTWN